MYIFIFAEGLSKLDDTYEGHIKLFSQFILVCIDTIAYTPIELSVGACHGADPEGLGTRLVHVLRNRKCLFTLVCNQI